ncbi:MAG: hypothetical protein ACKVGV_02545 [Sphingomonadales bacterium]|jgi:hypothetical protein
MTEVYLSEDAEEQIKQGAINKVLVATIATLVARDRDPSSCLANLREVALGAAGQGSHSQDAETNEYARNLEVEIVEAFLNQISIGGGD